MKMSLRILAGLIVLVVFTQFQLELNLLEVNIPVTGQTLAVLLVAYVLGLKEGVITIMIYLIIGLIGAPIFADGGNGISAFTGNSGGYLIGFLFGGILTGFIAKKYSNNIVNSLIAALLGTCVILFFGVAKLSFHIGFSDAIKYGLNPFILGGLIKVILGGLLGWWIKKGFPHR